MSSNDLNARHLGRLLRSLSTAGLVIGERAEAGRSRHSTGPTADRPADPDHGYDRRAVSILRRLDAAQHDRLVAAMGEVERLLAASSERPHRDNLGEMLTDIGWRIAQHGAAAEPRIRALADALRRPGRSPPPCWLPQPNPTSSALGHSCTSLAPPPGCPSHNKTPSRRPLP